MTDFLNINRGGAKQESENVGGGRPIFDSNVYSAKVKQAYLDVSPSGAKFCDVTLDINGKDYQERLWLTNSKGEGFYLDRDNNPQPMGGLTRFDELLFAAGFANAGAAGIGPANVRMWDNDSRAFVIKQHATVVTGLRDKEVLVALLRQTENKTKRNQNTGKYEKINEKIETNSIQKFASPSKQTQLEAVNKVDPPTFIDAWVKQWEGKVRDNYKQQKNAASEGIPSASGGAAAADDIFG